MPLHSGNWQVCLMDEEPSWPGEKLACARLKVLPMDEEDIENSYIEPTKKKFRLGEPITANFYTPKPIMKQWVAIYALYDLKGKKETHMILCKN